MAIEALSFAQPWQRAIFEAEVVFPRAVCLAALLGPYLALAGYLILWLVVDEAQIQNVAVDPAARGRGVARALLLTALGEARRRGATWASLEVRPSNQASRRLYAGLGFAEVGRRRGYYQPENEDALLLNASLEPWPPPTPESP